MSSAGGATLRRIVVGVDGSECSVNALQWAQRIGDALGAEIDAVTSWQYPVGFGMAGGLPEWDPAVDAAQLLDGALNSAFGEARPAGLHTSLYQGHPAKVLVDASVDAEMLVVGSRGHGGFVGMLIGATSAYCAEHAKCAVLVVHDNP